MLGHDLTESHQRSTPILVRESLPELVQIQCLGKVRRSRRPPFCDPCIAVLLARRGRAYDTSRQASKKRMEILSDMPSTVEAGYDQWQGDCHFCNAFKGPNLAGLDPRDGTLVPLFNPRVHVWEEHFATIGAEIVGTTPIGRATVSTLNMNESPRVELRAAILRRTVQRELP